MKHQYFQINGVILVIVAVVFAHMQTKAYGGNYVPQSTPEAICDLISVVISLVGVVLVTVGFSLKK